jgi:hypothetical protein
VYRIDIDGCDTFAETKTKKIIKLKKVAPKIAMRAGPRFCIVSVKLLKFDIPLNFYY